MMHGAVCQVACSPLGHARQGVRRQTVGCYNKERLAEWLQIQ
jgi:hypothetical protein